MADLGHKTICPHCRQNLRFAAKALGTVQYCPACGKPVLLASDEGPQPSEQPSPRSEEDIAAFLQEMPQAAILPMTDDELAGCRHIDSRGASEATVPATKQPIGVAADAAGATTPRTSQAINVEAGCLIMIILGIGLPLVSAYAVLNSSMAGETKFFVLLLGVVAIPLLLWFYSYCYEESQKSRMTPQQLRKYEAKQQRVEKRMKFGRTNPVMVCPHCQTKGKVRTKAITQKAGISGAKATGAILTGGVSLLATGLSRKEAKTIAHCDNCDATWTF